MPDVTDTWLGRAIRDAAAAEAARARRAARRVPTEDEIADDRTERYADAVADDRSDR